MDTLLFYEIFLLFFGLTVNSLNLPSVDRIVDGSPINVTQIPYILSYMVNGQHACGAAIINKDWGLTAAHCVIPFINNPSDVISVRSGSNRHDEGGVVHNVMKVIYHENYSDATNEYDIAVLKVHPPFDFNNVTQPVKLPENRTTVKTDWGLVAGWGYFLEYDPVLSETLEYVILPKVPKEQCVKDYENRYKVTDHQVCYGFRQGGKDSCKGDSGGPLVNDYIVIGITSWGSDCGEPNSPGVYTDVITLVDWINNKTISETKPKCVNSN